MVLLWHFGGLGVDMNTASMSAVAVERSSTSEADQVGGPLLKRLGSHEPAKHQRHNNEHFWLCNAPAQGNDDKSPQDGALKADGGGLDRDRFFRERDAGNQSYNPLAIRPSPSADAVQVLCG